MKIAVGSKNPVKVAAVENVARKVWPNCEVTGVEVDSGVSVQPRSDDEAILGATNRARAALEAMNADYGVGLEAAAIDRLEGTFTNHWVVVVNRAGEKGVGGGGGILLPEKVAAEIQKGRELGPVMDEFIGEDNTKQKNGAVGILTNDIVTRTSAFEKTVAYALTRFINPQYYK